jgi:hypothetical protein
MYTSEAQAGYGSAIGGQQLASPANKIRESRLEMLVMRLEKGVATASAQGNVLSIIADRVIGPVPEPVDGIGKAVPDAPSSAISRLERLSAALDEALSRMERQINRFDTL